MDNPLVSVIIPCYNAEQYIREALDSIIEQTYKNIEIICVDDFSSDNTLDILNEYSKIDSRIKVIANKQNIKIAAALNLGISKSCGEFIARMDADDISAHDRIEKQIDFMMSNADIDICGTWCELIDGFGKHIGDLILPIDHKEILVNFLFGNSLAHPSVMFKRSIFETIGGYKDMMPVEDIDYWITMIEQGVRFANIPIKLLKYRRHTLNITIVLNDYRKTEKLKRLIKNHSSFYLNTTIAEKYFIKYYMGDWGNTISYDDFKNLEPAFQVLLDVNNKTKYFEHDILKKSFKKYKCIAYFAILKNSSNYIQIRIHALFNLIIDFKYSSKVLIEKFIHG